MPLVLFNIGWMKHYQGQTPFDRISKGGRFVQKNKIGGEVRNFEPVDGWCYGYVRVPGGGNVKLTRLDPGSNPEYADDVTVVFTATRPKGGRVVVGWYRHARVWHRPMRRGEYDIKVVAQAKQENCRLLNVDDRVFPVPSAGPGVAFGMGTSNIRYTDEPRAKPFVRRLREYIEDPDNWPRRSPGSTPRQPDPEHRAKVERAAVAHVIDHYSPRYDCVSVERENKGWDLEFTQGETRLLVEVKGCSGAVGTVELTPNEYAAMRNRRYRDEYRLAIVTRALEDPRLSIISFNGSDKTWRDQHDREVCLEPRLGVRVITAAVDDEAASPPPV